LNCSRLVSLTTKPPGRVSWDMMYYVSQRVQVSKLKMATWHMHSAGTLAYASKYAIDKGKPVARRGRKAMGLLRDSRAAERRSTPITTPAVSRTCLLASHVSSSGEASGLVFPLFYYFGNGGDDIPGRSRGRHPRSCNHKGTPVITEPANDRVRAKCLSCGTRGPERDDAEEARKALEQSSGT
jgi:hypothetical protein